MYAVMFVVRIRSCRMKINIRNDSESNNAGFQPEEQTRSMQKANNGWLTTNKRIKLMYADCGCLLYSRKSVQGMLCMFNGKGFEQSEFFAPDIDTYAHQHQ